MSLQIPGPQSGRGRLGCRRRRAPQLPGVDGLVEAGDLGGLPVEVTGRRWAASRSGEAYMRRSKSTETQAAATSSSVSTDSDSRSVVAYDGEVRQPFSICLACRRIGGSVSANSDESLEVRFVAPEEVIEPEVSPAIQLKGR
jgi:hypothetical protein